MDGPTGATTIYAHTYRCWHHNWTSAPKAIPYWHPEEDPGQHQCFKNWDESSQAMAADVIVEGCMIAENDRGVRYMRLFANGDSSEYAGIQEAVPIWGPHVTKLECVNHACKCFRSSLEKSVDILPKLKGRGKLTLPTRIR
ncbi:hypothetical protein LOTGIDRAFT_153902 [Lottia gigantea]|uniref:Mutator-like transposase domain-containing protein n=1 Tax=Lottia gigantea TaxID=225164 RepID=V3ZJK6_LOTGI|nr:hypothetical protein LOTGIDRAFT_153902 [Lottia gigantea]ESO91458.1 hypothetical protein LOTGIDRAFT_153902 [Lottia gigantea]